MGCTERLGKYDSLEITFPGWSIPSFVLNLWQMTLSSSSSVVLVNVETASSGNYRCEVSIEAPSFETDVEEAPFIVLGKSVLFIFRRY